MVLEENIVKDDNSNTCLTVNNMDSRAHTHTHHTETAQSHAVSCKRQITLIEPAYMQNI